MWAALNLCWMPPRMRAWQLGLEISTLDQDSVAPLPRSTPSFGLTLIYWTSPLPSCRQPSCIHCITVYHFPLNSSIHIEHFCKLIKPTKTLMHCLLILEANAWHRLCRVVSKAASGVYWSDFCQKHQLGSKVDSSQLHSCICKPKHIDISSFPLLVGGTNSLSARFYGRSTTGWSYYDLPCMLSQ